MKFIYLAQKEAKDILSNRIYLLVVLVQIFIILGAYGLAITSTVITDPDLLDQWGVASSFKVGLPLELQGSILEQNLENENLILLYFPSVEEGLNQVGNEIIAMIYISSDTGNIGLQIDNNDLFYPVASNKINEALSNYQLEEQLSTQQLSPGQIKVIKNPIELEEIAVNKESYRPLALESAYFVEIMYGFIVPFILFLPFFLASNIVTDSIVGEKERKTFEVLLMTPLSGPMVIAGKILPILLFSLLQSTVWIVLLYLLRVPLYNPLLIMFLLFFVGLGFVGMGVIISMLVESTKEANSAITLLLFFATFILFLPLFIDIPAFSSILNMIPTMIMIRVTSSPTFNPYWLLEIIPTILISIAIFLFAIRFFREESAIRL